MYIVRHDSPLMADLPVGFLREANSRSLKHEAAHVFMIAEARYKVLPES